MPGHTRLIGGDAQPAPAGALTERRLPWATLNIAGLRPKPQAQGLSAHRQQARPPNGHHPKGLCAGSVLHMGHLPACPRPGPQAGSPAAGSEGERLPLVRGGASGPQWEWCSRSCHTSSWPFKDLPSGSVTSPRVGKDFSERTSLGNVLSGSGDHLAPKRSRDENTVPPRTLPWWHRQGKFYSCGADAGLPTMATVFRKSEEACPHCHTQGSFPPSGGSSLSQPCAGGTLKKVSCPCTDKAPGA